MTEEETVYADWGALRLLAPAVGAIVVLGLGGFLGYRLFGPEPGLSSAPVEQADESEASDDLPVLDPQQAAELVLDDFLGHLVEGRFDGLTFAFNEPEEATADFASITGQLEGFTIEALPGPVSLVDAANATAPLEVAWTLEDGVQFTTVGKVDLLLVGTQWLVDWEPAIIELTLDPGDSLVRERVTAPRAPIFGRDGFELVGNREVINVGVLPRRSDDIAGLSQRLGQLLGMDPGDIQATIAPSPSDSIVPIVTRRSEELQQIQGQLASIPGVVLEPGTYPLPPNDQFGRALLGRSADVTAEILEELPEVFLPGDISGRSGLQRQYNERLAGLPGFQIRVDRRFPTTTPSSTTTTTAPGDPNSSDQNSDDPANGVGNDSDNGDGTQTDVSANPDVVFLSAPVAGTPLNLTIDQRFQNAAENALAQTELPSSLVAIEVSSGHVLAVANGPGAAVSNHAMTGQYAPGSIFKTITAYGAMERGLAPSDPIDCPLTLNVNGRDFTNAEGEVLGTVAMQRNYVLSCNTAFINIGNLLEPSDFPNTAAKFGIGQQYTLGTTAFSGSVPTPSGPVDRAATAFGQSQVLFSPLSAAVMAATAAGGTYRPPVLIMEPDAVVAPEQPLDPALADNLRRMMRAVVTNGTGRAVSNVAGGPVSGKTGTAEFGNENPPRSHAWFVGFQGDVAFAVFVEGGEFGGATAAPIAGSFLNQLSG